LFESGRNEVSRIFYSPPVWINFFGVAGFFFLLMAVERDILFIFAA